MNICHARHRYDSDSARYRGILSQSSYRLIIYAYPCIRHIRHPTTI